MSTSSGPDHPVDASSDASIDLVVDTVVAAPPRQAYAAWIEPDRLRSWWWPMFPDTRYEVDARVGGGYLFETEVAGIGVRGSYAVLEPGERIECTWVWREVGRDGDDEDPIVITFAEHPEGTLVRTVHTTAARGGAQYEEGWRSVLPRLGRVLDPGAAPEQEPAGP